MKFVRNAPALKQWRQELRHNQTETEKKLWSCVRNKQFYGMRFFRQYSIRPYILDFYCPTLKQLAEKVTLHLSPLMLSGMKGG